MANEINQKPDQDQTDRILAAVEKILTKQIERNVACWHRKLKADSKVLAIRFVALCLLGCGSGAIVANTYFKNQQRDEQVLQEAVQAKATYTKQILEALNQWTDLRNLSSRFCPSESITISQERIKARYGLLRASKPMTYYLGEDFTQALGSFIAWEQSIDYCHSSISQDAKWDQLQKSIKDKMSEAPTAIFCK